MDALLRRRAMMAAGGGSPTPPGPTPEFYNYLVFDGNTGIETTITFPENCSLRVVLGKETVKKSQGVFFASDGSGRIELAYMGNTNSTSRQMGVWYDSPSAIKSNDTLAFSTSAYAFFMTPSGYGWDSTWKTYTKGSHHPTNAVLHLAMATNSQRYTGKMGAFQIYGSDASGCKSYSAFASYTPVITLRPCLYQGVAGLWYVEGNTFFGANEGTGTLSVTDTM